MDSTYLIIMAVCGVGIALLLVSMKRLDQADDRRRQKSSNPQRINPWVWIILGSLAVIVLVGNVIKFWPAG